MSDTTMSNECPDSIAEHLRSIIVDGTTQCPLCGNTSVHEHTPAEIVIYRNGVKYGRSLNDPGQQLATTEWLLAESQAREKVLRDGLSQAAEDMAGWGAYASEYFQDKWNLAGDVKRLQHLASMPSDSTALDAAIAKAQREVLLEASNEFDKSVWLDACGGFNFARHLRGMADELKGGEQ